jgi:hypothetical protein
MALKLQQGQIWKQGDSYIRIVQLMRLEVAYKSSKSIKSRDGDHQHTTKKEFCRLIKSAKLITPNATEPDPQPIDPDGAADTSTPA